MATTVFQTETITLENYEDGEEIDLRLRTLPIARQRKFADVTAELRALDAEDPEAGDKEADILLRAAAVAIEPLVAKYIKKEGTDEQAKLFNAQGGLSKEYKAWLEAWMDQDSLYRILKVCGDLDLETPKALMKEAREKAIRDQTLA